MEIIELTFSETKYFKTDFQNKFKNSISVFSSSLNFCHLPTPVHGPRGADLTKSQILGYPFTKILAIRRQRVHRQLPRPGTRNSWPNSSCRQIRPSSSHPRPSTHLQRIHVLGNCIGRRFIGVANSVSIWSGLGVFFWTTQKRFLSWETRVLREWSTTEGACARRSIPVFTVHHGRGESQRMLLLITARGIDFFFENFDFSPKIS